MIATNAAYQNMIESGAHFEWRIANDSVITENTVIVSGKLMEGTLKQLLYKSASIGNVMARQLDFEFYKTVSLDVTKPLKLQFRAVNSTQQSAWYDKGEYWIDIYNTSKYTDKAKIRAYDSLLKANTTFLNTGKWTTITDLAVVQAIASDIGVSIEASTQALFTTPVDITDAPSIGENGTTSIQMLSYIGVMKGGNWIINDDNKLQLIPLFAEQDVGADAVDIGDAVTDYNAYAPETITGVCLWANDNMYYRYPDVDDDSWEALGGRKINAEMAIMASQALAQALYTRFAGKIYYPYSAPTAYVDPVYQLGDKITIKNIGSVICNQTIKLDALAASSLSADGLEQVNSSYPFLTSTERKIAQNEIKTQASLKVLGNSIESTVQTMDGMKTQIIQNSEGVQTVTNRLDGQESYMRWSGENSTLHIGATDAPSEAQIKPTGLIVVHGEEETLNAEGKEVKTKYFKATNSVTIGEYQHVRTKDHRLPLVYVGG